MAVLSTNRVENGLENFFQQVSLAIILPHREVWKDICVASDTNILLFQLTDWRDWGRYWEGHKVAEDTSGRAY